ncbi:MAG: FAD-binding protein [Candidatus Solibacter usitatus]|nr:FAD-binding protein [Candidatus Solibacter usitatus]
MSAPITPREPSELAAALATAAAAKQTITLNGAGSKRRMAGPAEPSDTTIATTGLARLLAYEPRDLTISVEAGMPYAQLRKILAENRQMIPLDPPFENQATIGGILASNSSGPRRRLYGTARDLVIGMQFATLEGKLIQSGGMVVKNVAGLDMAKLMIGSFGTLAAMAVVNFKVIPQPAEEGSVLLSLGTLAEAITARDNILKGVLQPASIDLLNPVAAAQIGRRGHVLALQFGGNRAVVERARREVAAMSDGVLLDGDDEARFWTDVRSFTQRFLDKFAEGAVVRVASTLAQLDAVLASIETAAIARAGSGVSYAYFTRAEAAVRWMSAAGRHGWKCVMEFSPLAQKPALELWPSPGSDFEMMKRVKQMFDPDRLLNRGRLYRLI